MFNIFNSSVFVEIGEAIGNVGKAVFGRKSAHVELVDQAFRRRLERIEQLEFPRQGQRAKPHSDVVEASFREVSSEQERV